MEEGSELPKFDYHLDESDPDILVLRRQGGAFVAAFSARGFTKEGIIEAAKEDYLAIVQAMGDRRVEVVEYQGVLLERSGFKEAGENP